ncbi:hypothetical protein WN944_015065 [Citrus x changshan-huyou]|uniref:Uncharacterized protein n=1 Tax=Citrus x changshan-huyou TaxID=2935761 RepID=A0AAP0M910_9ROSI
MGAAKRNCLNHNQGDKGYVVGQQAVPSAGRKSAAKKCQIWFRVGMAMGWGWVGQKGPKSSSTPSSKAGRRRERRDNDVGDGLVGDGSGVTTSFVGE